MHSSKSDERVQIVNHMKCSVVLITDNYLVRWIFEKSKGDTTLNYNYITIIARPSAIGPRPRLNLLQLASSIPQVLFTD